MCGIAGILHLGDGCVSPDLITRMIKMVRHRGPDDSGVLTEGPVGLGHTRLSIIDLAGGHQPMTNEARTIWITFNGEIFNYLELREQLTRKGYTFRTCSDTEVLLRLYEEKGEDCVADLNGQWAFAIWDARRRRLFLSRDRLGVRPLFYTIVDRTLVFASEIKSIFVHPAVSREIDLVGLDQVFTLWCTIPPTTTFKHILELPPGHSLLASAERLEVKRHWRLNYPPAVETATGSERDLAERLLHRLLDATRLRLRSDVPVGAYLSGGLDSSLVAALISRFTNTPLRTFSVAFDDQEFDERPYQRQVVSHLGTSHDEIRCSREDIGRVFPEVVWHAEKPLLRTAPAPLYLLSQLVRKNGYKVVLTGEGADEVFGGYDIFKEAKIRRFWAARPDSKHRPRLLRRLYPYLHNLRAQPDAYLQAFFSVRPEDHANPLFSHLPRWRMTGMLKRFFSESVNAELGNYDVCAMLRQLLPAEYDRWDPLCQAQYLETAYLLPGYILSSQGDRVAMAHAVEGRFPFLDHTVAEFGASLPPRLKMKVLAEKYILKQAAADLLPAGITQRPKQPYRAPEAKCFLRPGSTPPPLAYVDELLDPARVQKDGIFNPVAVSNLVEKARRGQAIGIRDNMAVVGILSVQLLIDQFVLRFPH